MLYMFIESSIEYLKHVLAETSGLTGFVKVLFELL